jgi:hypothetical protein
MPPKLCLSFDTQGNGVLLLTVVFTSIITKAMIDKAHVAARATG